MKVIQSKSKNSVGTFSQDSEMQKNQKFGSNICWNPRSAKKPTLSHSAEYPNTFSHKFQICNFLSDFSFIHQPKSFSVARSFGQKQKIRLESFWEILKCKKTLSNKFSNSCRYQFVIKKVVA